MPDTPSNTLANYVYKDPTLPELIGPVTLPLQPGTMDFKVDGFRGVTDSSNLVAMYTLEHQAACAYVTIVNAINLANHYLKQPLRGWSSVVQLFVEPRAGKQLNAYYDRQGLKFFYATDPVTQKMVYTANSMDVVCHETGHAILDSLRPDLYNVQAMEVWAFHEAFGDIHAIINMLQHDVVLNALMKETNGNLKQENVLTKLAEEMGTAIFHMTGGRMGYRDGVLRNAFNTFIYVPPETLQSSGPDNQLCAEPHNFSRIFTGAWYDMLVAIYEDQKTKVADPKAALIAARDILAAYTFQAIPIAAATIRFYDAFARAMLVIDKASNYAYNQLMNQVFIARGILRAPVKPMVAMNWEIFKTQVEPNDVALQHKEVTAVRTKQTSLLSLPAYMLNVEAPADTYYEFNGTGDCTNIISPSPEELIEHAHACVQFLKANDMIRADKMMPFEIDPDGNLIRSHFVCGCGVQGTCNGNFGCGCVDNCHLPGQPEYGKCWKPENNAGCGCNGTSSCVTTQSEPVIVVQRNLRF